MSENTETKPTKQPDTNDVDMSCLVLMAENLQNGLKAQMEKEWSLANEHRDKAEALQTAFTDVVELAYELKKKIDQ